MAGRGPAPKDPSKRRRTNKDPVPTTTVDADGVLRGPDLPDILEDGWPSPTRTWWDTWRASAQAQAFTDTDWNFLLDTALLHARYWRGDTSVAAELRLRVAKFGATPEDRARLRMQVSEPTTSAKPAEKPKGSRYAHLRVAE